MSVTALYILLTLFTYGPAQQALLCPMLSNVGNSEQRMSMPSTPRDCEGLLTSTSRCFPNCCCSQQDNSEARLCVLQLTCHSTCRVFWNSYRKDSLMWIIRDWPRGRRGQRRLWYRSELLAAGPGLWGPEEEFLHMSPTQPYALPRTWNRIKCLHRVKSRGVGLLVSLVGG